MTGSLDASGDPVTRPPLATFAPGQRLTTREVCQLARLSRASVWRRIASGRLPGPIDYGRQALFCAQAVSQALNPPAAKPTAEDAVYAARFDRLVARRAEKALTLKKVQNRNSANSEECSEIRSAEAGLGPDRRNT